MTSIVELFAQSSKHIDLRWNAFELRFFDSLYDEKSAVIDNVIEHFDKDTYFRDIYIFIERIKNIAQIKDDTIVRNNLYTCLRETALAWYTSNLGEDQKRLVKLSNGVNKWIRVLLKKFRQPLSIAKDWAIEVMNRLLNADWGNPATIISDRDSKFLSEFWDTIFRRLEVSLLTSIVYHVQTDEQFERSNQTIEIAIRFLTLNNSDVEIVATLSTIQSQLNNSSNVVTRLSSNEIIYDIRVRDTILTLNQRDQHESITNWRKKYQTKVSDAIAFVNAEIKVYYDFKHKSLLLNSENKVYLRLNKSYKLSNHHKKLFQQRCKLFLVKRKVERLAYELKLFSNWRIHSIISIVQLKSALNIQNSYNRFRSNHSNTVKIEKNTKYDKFYEIERILAKRIRKYKRIAITQYLIKWFEYDHEFNEWKSISTLNNCLNLVQDFEQKHQDLKKSQ